MLHDGGLTSNTALEKGRPVLSYCGRPPTQGNDDGSGATLYASIVEGVRVRHNKSRGPVAFRGNSGIMFLPWAAGKSSSSKTIRICGRA
jgi:hypothetical protein